MDQTCRTHLIPGDFVGDEADPFQDFSPRNDSLHLSEVNPLMAGVPRRNRAGSSGPTTDKKAPVGIEKRNA
jgi:hypothetical protein